MLVDKHVLWQYLLIVFILVYSSILYSAEIQSFGYLGYEGQLNLDYLTEDNFIGVENEASVQDLRIVKQGNLDLLFHTFIYHPNFLKFDFGVGFVLTKTNLENTTTSEDPPLGSGNYTEKEPVITSLDDSPIDYNLRFSFFEKKDYPFSLFYIKKHPPLTATSLDAFVSENTRYGLKFLWNAPIVINFDAIHFETKGDSNLRVVNEIVDSTTFKAFKALSNNGYHQLSLIHQISLSQSGSKFLNLPITKNTTDIANYDSQFYFGKEEEFNLNLKVNYQRNRDSFEFDEIGILPGFRWKHTERLKSFYQYSYNENLFPDYKVINHAVISGLTYVNQQGISNALNFSALRTELEDATTNRRDLRNSTTYNSRFRNGSFSINGVLAIGQQESLTTLPELTAREEIILGNTTDFVTLSHNNVVRIDEIKITAFNDSSIVYIQNVDYEVRDINGVVSIARTLSGRILEGDKVSVTYFYDPGGNNVFQQENKSISSQLNFFKYFNLFAGYSNLHTTVLEGTLAANQVTSRITDNYGAGIDFPLFTDDIILGAETRYDNTDENITSIKSNTQLIYTQLRLLRSTSLYLSRRHTVTDYRGGVNVDNDVDKTTYHALLKIQPSHRTSLSLVYDDSEDVGSSRIRSYTDSSVRFEWNYRRILVNLTGSLLKEKQGTQIRNRSAIHLNMIRTF